MARQRVKTKAKKEGPGSATRTKKKASPLSVRRARRSATHIAGSKAQRGLAVKDSTPRTIVGIDLGDRFSQVHVLSTESGEHLEQGRIATTKEGFTARFADAPRARVALETGTHSAWVARLLADLGHEVLVANARKVRLISDNERKNDKLDAERLALLARADPRLLHPVRPRGAAAQTALVTLKARDSLVRGRTGLINTVRGVVKASGARLPKCSADAFHKHAEANLPGELQAALQPLVAQIAALTATIKHYDGQVRRLAKEFPETELLSQVNGVGALTALAFLLTVEDPKHFANGGKVAAYLGLCPRQDSSCTIDKQLRITKSGNSFVRRLMVTSAHYVLGPFGTDSDLRRWGLKLCERGGKNGKKRAVVAVARKLAVLLRHLWLTGQVYDPLHNSAKTGAASAEKEVTVAAATAS
jgi:transposase